MNPSVTLEMEISVSKGRGYIAAEENKNENANVGVIAIDSIYTPIKNVKYSIENYRVEQKTDYEKLIIDISTDGSIHPEEALKEAAKILIQHFMLFSDERIMLETQAKEQTNEVDEEILHMRKILKTELVDMDLSVRALNCLKAADIRTLADLVTYDVADMLKFRNFGKKSLTEIQELVKSKGLSFGMNLSKFKLDEE
jgi:DNA-directed RNA polymerase subunit alpha